jgi:putative phosphoribosyl transferase
MDHQTAVSITSGSDHLAGDLVVPQGAIGLVVFVHGSGSSRFSKRNRYVAETLNQGGLATLLLDLLTVEEEEVDRRTAEYRFDIERLSTRVGDTLAWLQERDTMAALPIGLFGSSTGAAAALNAAARHRQRVAAVVSRGGRPDLASAELPNVHAPVLLIVGGLDRQVLTLNRQAAERLTAATHEISIVDGATHLFEERGKLEQVAGLARDWFRRHLASANKAGKSVHVPR